MPDDNDTSKVSFAEVLARMPDVGLDSDFAREPAPAVGVLPTWICADCGAAWVGAIRGDVTWHQGTCGICGEDKAVTQFRNFGARR